MKRYYVVKCGVATLEELLTKEFSKHRFVSRILFKNTIGDVVLEQLSDQEIDWLYDKMEREKRFTPGPNNTCNND